MGRRRGRQADPGPEFFEAAVTHNPVALVGLDARGRVGYLSDRATHLLTERHLLGRAFAELFSYDDRSRADAYVAGLAGSAGTTGMFFAGELGSGRFVHVHGRNLGHSGGRGLLLALVDATEARRRQADLERSALFDTMTGLPNRTLFQERLRTACEQEPVAGALMMLDLDGFKQVNDALGHQQGDHVLVEVARRLERATPASATVARLGGDEFVVLLPDTTLDVATKLAAALVDDVAAPFPGLTRSVTASVGVTGVDGFERSLRQADLAMYAAKSWGRNRVVVHTPEVERALRERQSPVEPDAPAEESVAELQAERDRLQVEARTDALTGLANRRSLDECLSAFRGPLPVSLLFVDLDRFGAYNHVHGDLRGDAALQRVATTLSRTCRDDDLVFRKGGEEFVVVLPSTDATAARIAGERVRAAVEALGLEHGGADDVPVVTVTVGAATRFDGDLAQALRAAGDTAYACKVAGHRNRVATSRG